MDKRRGPFRFPTVLLLAAGASIPLGAGAEPESPRLVTLATALQRGETAALESFWSEVATTGTPLVESLADGRQVLVTFLFRSEAPCRVVVLADFMPNVLRATLRRLPATDVWYQSFRMAPEARFLYELAVDDPAYPFVDGDVIRGPERVHADPLNRRPWDYLKPRILSLAELPAAPSMDRSAKRDDVPHGEVGRFAEMFASVRLNNERKVFVYRPPGYDEKAPPYPLLVFGASYINQIRLPNILDNLIAERRLPPVLAVFVDHPPGMQDAESGCDPGFADMLAGELLPWVRERVNATSDPRRTIIGGASAGGFSAACVAFRHPEAFGNVVAQSGAFWRGLGGTAADWGDAARDVDREGFTRLIASSAAVPVRYYLTIGTLESAGALDDGTTISMIHATRHLRDVLVARGYTVTLVEVPAAHDPFNWERTLPDALMTLLGAP